MKNVIIKNIVGIYAKFEKIYTRSTAERYEAYLRKKGIRIGKNIYWGNPKTINIDITRPCLVEIGDNVRLDTGLTILTHDFATYVFRLVYHDFVSATAKVTIGNNVYFGQKCTILKGVTIGDNCVIGLGSLITKDIPSNSVVAGSPAKVICTLEEYYQKRKSASIKEAQAYAREIQRYYNRKPVMEDFKEEFALFWSPQLIAPRAFQDMVKSQMGSAYAEFIVNNKPVYSSFEAFLDDCNLN